MENPKKEKKEEEDQNLSNDRLGVFFLREWIEIVQVLMERRDGGLALSLQRADKEIFIQRGGRRICQDWLGCASACK